MMLNAESHNHNKHYEDENPSPPPGFQQNSPEAMIPPVYDNDNLNPLDCGVIYPSPSAGDESLIFSRHKYTEPPNFQRFQMHVSCLILTTALAVGSALDARNECVSTVNNQFFAWMSMNRGDDDNNIDKDNSEDSLVDDDAVMMEGRMECLNMFKIVMLPVGVVTIVFGLLSLVVISRHLDELDSFEEGTMPSPFPPLLRLLPMLFVILLAWIYGIFSIMLLPKSQSVAGYEQNPYKSLAAVDQMGYIGDNANLYYLSWISLILSMTVVFRVFSECFRWWRKGVDIQPAASSPLSSDNRKADGCIIHQSSSFGPVHEMLSYTSAKRITSLYRERRKTWYQFMVKLRERSGYWVAAFFASIVIFASSCFVYFGLLKDVANEFSNDDFRYRDLCRVLKGSDEIPIEFCSRTKTSVIIASIASILCLLSMFMHLLVRRNGARADEEHHIAYARSNSTPTSQKQQHFLPTAMHPQTANVQLKFELVLSICLSLLLGVNAVIATGVQGPASSVGNLYYASWVAFILCLRVCLGCLEEVYDVHSHNADDTSFDAKPASPTRSNNGTNKNKDFDSQNSSLSVSEISIGPGHFKKVAKKERPARLRRYFFLFIFSAICASSALDAAYHQEESCSGGQRYLIFAPSAVAILSMVLFILCLKPKSYFVVSHICCGGLISVICFVTWLIDLIVTMHSSDSWAVNHLGELKLANLYYFSWASIVVAALQMVSYLMPLFGGKEKEVMIVVWMTIIKVSYVILGATLHVWSNIEGMCSEAAEAANSGNYDDYNSRGVTFCHRTTFAFIAAGTGIASGYIVIGSRIASAIGLFRCCCTISVRTRAKCEATLSLFLVMFFGIAVALITSIGGPGQSVGDLYYATWLAFWVCIGTFVSCCDEMKQEEMMVEIQRDQEQVASCYIDLGGDDAADNRGVVAKGSFA